MEKAMQKYLDKAEVLIEALPYIQRFNRKVIVVKYGGSAMVDEELKARVIQDVTLLKLVGFKPIIVHGGGKESSKWVGKVGMEPHFINGLRVTDAETMELAEMVLGKVNKSLVQLVEQLGVRAIGISGKDGGLLKVDKKLADGEDIGFVGDVKEVNADIIYDLVCHFLIKLNILQANRTADIDRINVNILLNNDLCILEDLVDLFNTKLDISLLILCCIILCILGQVTLLTCFFNLCCYLFTSIQL